MTDPCTSARGLPLVGDGPVVGPKWSFRPRGECCVRCVQLYSGGGIPGGIAIGETDELGSAAVVDPYHVHELHATILHRLGLEPNALTYRHEGLDKRLVGVEGAEPIAALV